MLSSSFSQRLSLHARHTLKEARDIAHYTKSKSIEARHLLLALALEAGSLGSILLENIGFKKEAIGKHCLKKNVTPRKKVVKKSEQLTLLPLAPEIQNVMKRAFFLASEHHYPYVGTEHVLSALLESPDPFIGEIMEALDVDPEKIDTVIEAHLHFERFPQMARMFDLSEWEPHENKSSSATPFLDQYTVDLAQDALQHPTPLVGRQKEMERLIQILGRKEKRNAILLGDPGVGKTALVTALAEKIVRGEAGPFLHGKRIVGLDLALLVAGTSFRGEFEARVKELLKEVRQNPNIILFIDEIHALVGTGNTQGGLDAANILKPALARGEIQCIGATTMTEYKRHLEKDAALERRFQPILLYEPTPEEAINILNAAKALYETHHQVSIPQTSVEEAVRLSVRYIPDRFLPDKAFDLIDEASALVRRRALEAKTLTLVQTITAEVADLNREKSLLIEKEEYERAAKLQKRLKHLEADLEREITPKTPDTHASFPIVDSRAILTVLSQMTHIPLERLTRETPHKRLAHLRTTLEEQVIGQTEVTQKVIGLLTRALSQVSDPHRPLGSLLLLGPTGVGKTYLAKVLAQAFFGDEQALIRLDMSEFMERHSVAQILGAPAGYVGYGEGGKLTEAIRRRPYSIVLFDEIEKAHPDVSNLLLQILDEGHLTDAEGRRVSFKNTLILITSNIGTAGFKEHARIGFNWSKQSDDLSPELEALRQTVMAELQETLRPELLSRIDQTLIFNHLSGEALQSIAALELQRLQQRLAEQNINLTIQTTVPKLLVSLSQAQNKGARHIKKHIAERIETLLAEKLLDQKHPTRLSLITRHGAIQVR